MHIKGKKLFVNAARSNENGIKMLLLSFFSEPTTTIIGGPDIFVDVGSMVNLSCAISHVPKAPSKVTWLHNGQEISFRGPRNGVSVITEKAKTTRVHLLMQGANDGDSGVYECVPDNAPRRAIKVHILKGKLRVKKKNILQQRRGRQQLEGKTIVFIRSALFPS